MIDALAWPGSLHILSGAMHEFLDSMPHYKGRVAGMLNEVANFLHHRWSRDLLVAECFSSGPALKYKDLFSTFRASLVGHRLGSVTAVLDLLEAREIPLRRFWNKTKILNKAAANKFEVVFDALQEGGGPHVEEPNEAAPEDDPQESAGRKPQKVSVAKFDEAVGSAFFWSYLCMLRVFFNDLEAS